MSTFGVPAMAAALPALPGYQPLQHGIQVGFFLGADSITTRLTVRDVPEAQGIDELVDGQLLR